MEKLIITPKTKIYDLLLAYPQLEDVLLNYATQFKKLKNPVLRKTITKITTLSQAAAIANVNVEVLVNKLRAEVGQNMIENIENQSGNFNVQKPEWYDENNISQVIDIRDMLHAGDQPVHEVLSGLKKLEGDQMMKVIAPFIPAPLIDKASSLDFKHYVDKKSEEEFWVFFHR